jgi:hypothetical protein
MRSRVEGARLVLSTLPNVRRDGVGADASEQIGNRFGVAHHAENCLDSGSSDGGKEIQQVHAQDDAPAHVRSSESLDLPAMFSRYLGARDQSQRHGRPRAWPARAMIWSGVGSPARNDLASTLQSDGFGMIDSGRMPQRVSPCVSTSAWKRSEAHATKSQLFQLPWGNPREAKPNPRARSTPSLRHSTASEEYQLLSRSKTAGSTTAKRIPVAGLPGPKQLRSRARQCDRRWSPGYLLVFGMRTAPVRSLRRRPGTSSSLRRCARDRFATIVTLVSSTGFPPGEGGANVVEADVE